jgi:hypothetical protein
LGAFVDAAKLQMDGGFRNITNNIAGLENQGDIKRIKYGEP